MERPTRRFGRILAAAVAGMTCLMGMAMHGAQAFPDRPLRIVVPFPPGGSNGVVARVFGDKLSGLLGQSIVVENRSGGGGNVGAESVAHAEPDGYTLLLSAPGPLSINQMLYGKLPFDPAADFAPVALIASVPIVFSVNPGVKATSVSELIALARARPGEMSFGSSGNGSTNHLAGELLKQLAHIDIFHVPYRGAAPAMNDLIAGHIPMMFDNMPGVRPQVVAGTIRALAVAGAKRSALFPELPTMIESGVAGFDASSWFGLVAPAATPPAVMKTLVDASSKVLQDAEIRKKFAELGAEPGAVAGAAFGDFLKAETDKWGKVIKTAGVKIE